jgi:hypothetical protein
MKKKTQQARRQFLKDSGLATAALGIGFFSFGDWRKAFAQARVTGRPVLTEQTLNTFIPKDRATFKRLAAEAKRDLPSFVRSRFSLTAAQEREIDGLTQVEQNQIRKAIEMAEKEGVPLRVNIRRGGRPGLRSSAPSSPSGLMPASFTSAAPVALRLKFDIGLSRDPFGKINGISISVSKTD